MATFEADGLAKGNVGHAQARPRAGSKMDQEQAHLDI